MKRYRKKTPIIRAMVWDGTEESIADALEFIDVKSLPSDGVHVDPGVGYTPSLGTLEIPTAYGFLVTARPGDFLVRDERGRFSVCDAEDFEDEYEVVE